VAAIGPYRHHMTIAVHRNPIEVVSSKLKKGEIIARENKKGVVILKWKYKRDVLMLFSKHSAEKVTIKKNNKTTEKPEMIVDQV
jgi:hypothetical protein